jgi:DNA-binding GntR family transcriptional regulator
MGARLGEVELAEHLGVSRTPVREALRRLAADGLVELQPNKGARVRSWSLAQLEDIHALRVLLEGHAASLAAETVTEDEVAELRDLCRQMERAGGAGDLDAVTTVNGEFHSQILRISRSSRLPMIYGSLAQVPLTFRTFRQYSPRALERSMTQHRDIVDALELGDPSWAKASMECHILSGRHETGAWVAAGS